ncbi:hypothetical protein VP1G_03514 [Cytospora mali]|uniref:DUF6536 domain-containing protein n=1 Tax=Cytospora mali TaxID=578113 RepID=A0A194UX31_CYTMA|nr:hypothetical protein VP1G_03514 [Valsa mali var. pyri (nom. inval.)]
MSVIFVCNLFFTIFAVLRYDSQKGVGLIYEGDCTTVGDLDLWIHLVINLLSTGMLSASNFCMQLQAAPTRASVDRAHENKEWMDIGVSSFRNLKYISKSRKAAWLLLALSSLPIHFLYNSAVFQSLTSFDYTVAVVKDSFLNDTTWSLETAENNRRGDPGWDDHRVNPPSWNYTSIIAGMQKAATTKEYLRKNVTECFDVYNDYFAPQGNVLIFVKNASIQTPPTDSLLLYVGIMPRYDDWAKNMWAVENGTAHFVLLPPKGPVTVWYIGKPHYEVDHCLVQQPSISSSICRFQYSPWIMWIICLFNFLKASVMLWVWLIRKWQEGAKEDSQKQILYTLGDAIASFMRNPSPETEGLCLATKQDFLSQRTWKNRLVKQWPVPSREPRPWAYQPKRWMQAASLRRCILIMVVVIILFSLSFPTLRHLGFSIDIPTFWSMGFGRIKPYTYLVIGLPKHDPQGLIANVLLANLPQFILSIMYVFYNAMMSTFLVQHEFSSMYKEKRRKPLRVSEPIGIQRGSYFISLPLRYGIPLYASSGLMHWMISQSLFLARITALEVDGTPDPTNSFSTCGYSPFAIFICESSVPLYD